MDGLVIAVDKVVQTSPELVKRMEIPHIQGSHPLVLHGTEPAFDLGLLCRGIGMAVADGRADAGRKKLHLFVFVGRSIVKVEHLWLSILGYGRFHDRHKIYKGIIKKYVNSGDEPACVVDQGDHIDAVLFSVIRLKIWSHAGITTPYFIDVRPFIAAHVLVAGQAFLQHHLVDESAYGCLGYLLCRYAALILELSVNG